MARRKGWWELGGGGQRGDKMGTSVLVSKIKMKLNKRLQLFNNNNNNKKKYH